MYLSEAESQPFNLLRIDWSFISPFPAKTLKTPVFSFDDLTNVEAGSIVNMSSFLQEEKMRNKITREVNAGGIFILNTNEFDHLKLHIYLILQYRCKPLHLIGKLI